MPVVDGAMPPFFVVGAQRSGTTMLRLMLNQHSRLCVPFESAFIPDFHRRLAEFGDLAQPAHLRALLDAIAATPFVVKGRLVPDVQAVLERKPAAYPQLVDAIFSTLAAARGKPRWGDKTPSYVTEMDVLWELFPGCKFIHLVRDGRDVALSLRGLSWGSKDLVRVAQDWRWKVTLGRKMGEMVRDHYLEVRYEDLVRSPRFVLATVCDFLGEAFEPALLDYPRSAADEMPAQSLGWHRSSVSAPDASKADGWRTQMRPADQIVFDEVAGATLEAFGYERVRRPRSIASRLRFARYALLGQA